MFTVELFCLQKCMYVYVCMFSFWVVFLSAYLKINIYFKVDSDKQKNYDDIIKQHDSSRMHIYLFSLQGTVEWEYDLSMVAFSFCNLFPPEIMKLLEFWISTSNFDVLNLRLESSSSCKWVFPVYILSDHICSNNLSWW